MMNQTTGKHIHSEYDAALDSLRADFAKMFGLVDSMLSGAQKAIQSGDVAIAEEARKTDRKVDELDRHICETIVQILAQWQPLASDLRFILACSRSVGHLERCGDYIRNICKRLRRMVADDVVASDFIREKLLAMMSQAQAMLKLTGEAFVEQKVEGCDTILRMDNILDDLHKEIFMALRKDIIAGEGDVEVALESMLVSKNLERMGDHVTNIAEMVAFSVAAETYARRQVQS